MPSSSTSEIVGMADQGSPGQTTFSFARALLGGDATAAAAYFSADARLLTPDGTEVSGRAPIIEVLEQLTSPGQKLQIRERRTVYVGATALCTQRWTIRSSVSEPFERSFPASFVLSHEAGRWRLLIAAPWG
jgi:ketosteroid isomerase-like protein